MNLKKSLIAALSIATVISSIAPASAMPIQAPTTARQVTANVDQIQYRRWDHREGWYHGHRGYRDHRRGYRRHSDGWWYPLAAFGAGALISGAVNNANRPARVSSRHYEWCASRYKTYRASDNTYVPRAGVRAVCQSPYS
ncbi:BA14K family protein [Rhizobium sp. AN80A]|uniref:BA14K family protein n=2 Tax=unclassified Rhizobium TaxID=2613769 RepID=UPI000DD4F0DE|nr:BA14K family protein [Rhizobium sp. AN80A]